MTMRDPPVVDAPTLQAYRETLYTVQASPPFVLQVGQHSAQLADLCRCTGADCAAYLTACNPWSEVLDDATNAQRQSALLQAVEVLGLQGIAGVGRHPSNGWPGEASCLVPGLSLAQAQALGRQWDQNAILWAGSDFVPQLILLR